MTVVGVCSYAYPMKLYNYFRSSASFRVRIALNLKGLAYEYVPVHIAKGDHKREPYATLAADTLVPMLETDDGARLSQSMAIIEYLDELHPTPPLLPADALGRAQVRALAQMVACEMHPPTNLRVLKYLTNELAQDDEHKSAWYHHWCRGGLEAFERQLQALAESRARRGLAPSIYCYGDSLTLADCCLLPQIYNAQRFAVPLDGLPLTMAAHEAGLATPAAQKAHPSACPDSQP